MLHEPTTIGEEPDRRVEWDRSSREHALTSEEDERFRKACVSNPRHAARWVFMYCCMAVFGMRVSEMTHLRLEWFDVSRPGEECIRIPRSMPCDCHDCRKSNGVWTPKTRASARVIPGRINIEAFWAVYTYMKEATVQMSLDEVKKDPVPRDRRRVWETIRRLGRKAGIRHSVFPHALRATAATRIAQIPGMTAAQLMYIMGWSRIETANEYIRMAGTEVLKIFKPSEHELRKEVDVKKAVNEILFLARSDSTGTPDTCTVCGAKVFPNEDGSWECQACGAMSSIEDCLRLAPGQGS